PFHRAVMEHEDFTNGEALRVHTRWIETDFAETLAAAARAEPLQDTALVRTAIEIDGRRVALGLPAVLLQGLQSAGGGTAGVAAATPAAAAQEGAVPAPVAGTVQAWKVAEGDTVAEGDVVAVMEAMKMEMQVTAPRAGRITDLVATGSYQAAGAPLARVAS
ncbi:biotin/lipoyl-binding protein, partial [Corallococcus coralloides]|nr:biotin/lipoyl-binding protein [Corallococcus coralloides]